MNNATDSKKQTNSVLICDFDEHSFGGPQLFWNFYQKQVLSSFWVILIGNALW